MTQRADDFPQGPSGFATTQWSLVLRAGAEHAAESALAELCSRYWYPVYAFVRRQSASASDAQDVTQEFFTRLLEKKTLAQVSPERGRFRSFLRTAVKNLMAGEWERAHAQKRGGAGRRLTLDFDAGESRYCLEPVHAWTAERLFDRRWALALLEGVMKRLEAEYEGAGKAEVFARLKESLSGGGARVGYVEIAAALGMTEEAARQAAARLRKRYRAILREEVAHTVADESEVDDEIRSLFDVLGDA